MKATQSAVIAVAASLALLIQGCFEDPAAKSISAPPSTMKVCRALAEFPELAQLSAFETQEVLSAFKPENAFLNSEEAISDSEYPCFNCEVPFCGSKNPTIGSVAKLYIERHFSSAGLSS